MTEEALRRPPGFSVRLKLTLSYAGFLLVAGIVLLTAVGAYVLRHNITSPGGNSALARSFGPIAVAVLAFLLVFGLLGGWILAGRMLAPLAYITEAARIAATGSLSHRIRLPGRQDEFRDLADSFDVMLARLGAHVDKQRRFAANASHELRTPLSITHALLDVARSDPSRPASELDERLRTVNTRAIELTEALLLLSHADQRSFARETVDLSLTADEAAEILLPLAEAHDVTLEINGDDTVPTIGSPTLLLQLTTNLVHNAIVHNLPTDGVVIVTTRVQSDGVVLTVQNTGEVLAPQLVSTLTEPFQRGTARVRTDHAGVGLGLAIVESITHAHGGILTLTPRPAGGLTVCVCLPKATPAEPNRYSAPER